MKKLLLFAVFILSLVIFVGCNTDAWKLSKETVSSPLVVEEVFQDLGTAVIDGGDISTIFEVKNTGTEPIVVTQMYTSCMCTESRLVTQSKTSRFFGMQGHSDSSLLMQIIEPGETAEVEAVFDPSAHGINGLGTNRRAVYFETNSDATPLVKLEFTVEIVTNSDE